MSEIFSQGRFVLFRDGWTTSINQIKLYTANDILVDTKTISFSLNATTHNIDIASTVTFDVDGGTTNVAYAVIGKFTEGIDPAPDIFTPYYREDFSNTYDFISDGELYIDVFTFSLTNNYITDIGKDILWVDGWEDKITWAKLYTNSATLVDQQSITFSADTGLYSFIMDNELIFDVTSGTNNVSYIRMGFDDGTPYYVYYRTLPQEYDFPTTGSLKVSEWNMGFYIE